MTTANPKRVLITGGREIGGVGSFADSLRQGFNELGIPVEVLPPGHIFRRWRDLRDPEILKILSTSAVFAAPFSRRAICLAHGVPRADYQGWWKLLAIVGSFKLASICVGTQLVSVSHFTAATLRAVFDVQSDAVIHNPVKPIYLERSAEPPQERSYITYVGRLIAAKNLHRMFPAILDLLNESPGLRACIIGEGELRSELEGMIDNDPRFEFKGTPDDCTVRELLRQTRVFVSGNEVEGFGITYLEALTQGCIIAMPAGGGGLEIASDKVGGAVQLLPLSWDRAEVLATLRRALLQRWSPICTATFTVSSVVDSYLRVDRRFLPDGHRSNARNSVFESTAL